ncbi:MAG: hypothetical protein Q7W30_01130 [Coriobacteriia bacterium]|nr:hypothetical protein [Coriobacteriia bacterium]
MKRTLIRGLAIALLLVLALPVPVFAASHLQSRVVSQVSGAQMAEQLLAQTKGVALGATAATVTMNVNGKQRPLRIDFGEVAKGLGGAEGEGSLMKLALIPLVAGIFFKAVGFLSHLGR